MYFYYFYYFYIALIYPIIEKMSKKFNKILLFLGIFPLFLVLATQDAIGTDYYSYIRIFYNKVQFLYSRGAVFKFIIINLRELTDNYRYMFISVALIQSIVFSCIIFKLYKEQYIKIVSLFLLLSLSVTNFYIALFNVLRSSIASLFFFLSILFFLKHNKIKSIILFFLSIGFHPVTIFSGSIFFLKKLFEKKFSCMLIRITIVIAYILNKINFIPKIVLILYKTGWKIPYRNYLISEHMQAYIETLGISTIINIILVIISLFFYRKEKNNKKIFVLNVGYLFFTLRILFANIPIFARTLEPANLFQTYIIYLLVYKTLNKKYLYFGIVVYIYYILVFIRSSFLILKAN